MAMNHDDWLKLAGLLSAGYMAGRQAGWFGSPRTQQEKAPADTAPAINSKEEAENTGYTLKQGAAIGNAIGNLFGGGIQMENKPAPLPQRPIFQLPPMQLGPQLSQGSFLNGAQQYGYPTRYF